VDHLRDCGFLPLEADNAHEAIEILQTGVEIDVVLTDVRMPGDMDGFGLAGWIRQHRPDLAVFVASGYSGKLDLAQELCSSEQFFAKPYDLDMIAARIHEHLAADASRR
jgi:CheY-like chemotaxis protein